MALSITQRFPWSYLKESSPIRGKRAAMLSLCDSKLSSHSWPRDGVFLPGEGTAPWLCLNSGVLSCPQKPCFPITFQSEDVLYQNIRELLFSPVEHEVKQLYSFIYYNKPDYFSSAKLRAPPIFGAETTCRNSKLRRHRLRWKPSAR